MSESVDFDRSVLNALDFDAEIECEYFEHTMHGRGSVGYRWTRTCPGCGERQVSLMCVGCTDWILEGNALRHVLGCGTTRRINEWHSTFIRI